VQHQGETNAHVFQMKPLTPVWLYDSGLNSFCNGYAWVSNLWVHGEIWASSVGV